MHHPVATGASQHLVLHLVLTPHPGAEDVLPAPLVLLQGRDRLLADHAPVGHDAHTSHAEATPQAIHDGDQRGHVGGVAGPQFAADRSALPVDHGPHDHLVEVGAVVFAEATLADVLSAFTLEVDRGGVEEHELKVSEEVAAVGEELLFDAVLGASGCEGGLARLLVLGQLLAEPGHGPVQVMELHGVAAFDRVVGLPLVGGAVAAWVDEAMQDGEEDGPFDVELEAAFRQQLPDDPLAPGLLPEPLEDEDRPDVPGGDGGEFSFGVRRQEKDVAAQSCTRDQEAVEVPGMLELIESPQGGDDLFTGLTVFPAVLNDLEVGAWSGGLGTEEHGALVVETP